mgnify:CR=1 FL=1
MFGLSFQEMLLVLVIVLLLFGPKKLPELARLLGRGLAEFRKAVNDVRSTMELDEISRYRSQENKPMQQTQDPVSSPPPSFESESEPEKPNRSM